MTIGDPPNYTLGRYGWTSYTPVLDTTPSAEQKYREGYRDGYRDGMRDAVRPVYPETLPTEKPRCRVCGMTFDVAMGYVCTNPSCPSMTICTSSTTDQNT